MSEMEAAYTLAADARKISMETSDSKAIKFANLAMKHAEQANGAHNVGDFVGASAHLSEASKHLQNAASIHTGKLMRGDLNVSPEMLDHAHLGKGHEQHQNYLDEINKGKNNGR